MQKIKAHETHLTQLIEAGQRDSTVPYLDHYDIFEIKSLN